MQGIQHTVHRSIGVVYFYSTLFSGRYFSELWCQQSRYIILDQRDIKVKYKVKIFSIFAYLSYGDEAVEGFLHPTF